MTQNLFVIRYGSIFKTSVAGHCVVVSADLEVNNYIFQQEGKSVYFWYMDAISKIIDLEGHGGQLHLDSAHKYLRSLFLKNIGPERIKQNLIPQFECMVGRALHDWSDLESIEARHAVSDVSKFFFASSFDYF